MAAKAERIKIGLVIGLSVVMIGNVYFRFIHPKNGGSETIRTVSAASPGIAIPRVTVEEPPSVDRNIAPPSAPAAGEIRDLFAPTAVLPQPPKPASAATKPPLAFKLKGTILGGERAMALIDDQYVRTGQRLGDFKVVQIGKKEVVIESEDKRVTLKILKDE